MTLDSTPLSADLAFDLALALVEERGWPETWRCVPRHTGLACAIIDAVMSPHIRSETVASVVARYGNRHSPRDGATQLQESFRLHGARWPDVIGTRNRVWRSVEAPLKSTVIEQAAHVMSEHNVETCADLRVHARSWALRDAWCALPGQASGATWRHLLLVSGYTLPMVCRLTRRFVRRYAPLAADAASDDELLAAMADVAGVLGTSLENVDHQMWRAGARGRPEHGLHLVSGDLSTA